MLPTDKDFSLYEDRPNDQVYAKIKHHMPKILEQSAALKEKFVQLIIDDLVVDHALAGALDDIGSIIEYQAQIDSVEKPKFNGLSILKDAERVGKLNFILKLCSVLNLTEETTEAVRTAEIERLWGMDLKVKKDGSSTTLKLPDEIAGSLKDLIRTLNKKGSKGGDEGGSSKHGNAASSLARTLRERAGTDSTTSKRNKK